MFQEWLRIFLLTAITVCVFVLLVLTIIGCPTQTRYIVSSETIQKHQQELQEQKVIIERLEQSIQQTAENLGLARSYVLESLASAKDLQDLFVIIDQFVRAILEIEGALSEN